MSEFSEKEILMAIQNSLEEIKSILVLVNEDRLQEVKKSKLKEGSVKLQVYNQCDGTKGLQEIAQTLQKSTDYVSSYLSILKREGLIRMVDKQDKQVLEQTF